MKMTIPYLLKNIAIVLQKYMAQLQYSAPVHKWWNGELTSEVKIKVLSRQSNVRSYPDRRS